MANEARPPMASRSLLKALSSRPEGLLQRVRWLLFLLGVSSALLGVPTLLLSNGFSLKLGALAAFVFLLLHWASVYLSGRSTLWWDGLEGMALLTVALAVDDPTSFVAISFFYGGICVKGTLDSLPAIVRVYLIYLGVHVGSVVARAGSFDEVLTGNILAQVTLFAIALVGLWALARVVAQADRAAARERTLTDYSGTLMTADTRDGVFDTALETALHLIGLPTRCRVAMLMYCGEGKLSIAASAGHKAEEIEGFNISVHDAPDLLESSLREQRPQVGHDLDIGSLGQSLTFSPKTKSVGYFPLVSQEDVIGALVCASDDMVLDEESDALGVLASQTALALERIALTASLRHSEARFRSLIQNASDVVALLDEQGRTSYVSPSVQRLLGYKVEERVGRNLFEVIHPEDVLTVSERLKTMLIEPGGMQSAEVRMRHKDGTWIWVEGTATNLLHDPTVKAIVVNYRDVSERKNLQEELTHQAFHDSLTNLPNRSLFLDRIEHALARSHRESGGPALLFLDLDDFKSVNDTLGHASGDLLLVEVARRLRECIRAADTLARFGGDEFGILLEGVGDPAEAVLVSERISENLRRPFGLSGRQVLMRASIGIVTDLSGQAAHDLLRNADTAMYVAKAQRKGSYAIFEPHMDEALRRRTELRDEIQEAIEKGQFVVHYQPIVQLDSGRLCGVEALVRWEHPERGLVSPAEFIPLAEDSGLIVPLGRWVLRQACRQVRAWQSEHPDLSVNVNVSARQLQDPHLTEDVVHALLDVNLAPANLTLEITESVLMEDTEAAMTKLAQLKSIGVRLAIDDFGTGYSSLAYLRQFPIDIIKVDKSFVSRLGTGSGDDPLVRAIVTLGHNLKLRTTAEGIESPEQVRQLQALGCPTGQGYLFSRPVGPDEMQALLERGTLIVQMS